MTARLVSDYLGTSAPERDALKPRDVLPVAPFGLTHGAGAALVSSPRHPDHTQQLGGLGLGEAQQLAGGGYFFGSRHGRSVARIRWLRNTLDTPVSVGYTVLVG